MKTAPLLIALLALGCYQPSTKDCAVVCGSGDTCPEGAVCSNGLCTTGARCPAGPTFTAGYIVQGDWLYKIEGNPYGRLPLSSGWSTAVAMVYHHSNGNDWVYIVAKETIWRVSGVDGAAVEIDTPRDWRGGAQMAWSTATGKLYIIDSGYLYRFEDVDNDATYAVLPPDVTPWYSSDAMTSLGDRLYVLKGDHLYTADPVNGDSFVYDYGGRPLSWDGATKMVTQFWNAGDSGHLYAIHGDNLYEMDRDTGGATIFGGANMWPQWTTMFCHGGASSPSLFVIENANKKLMRIDGTGGWHETDGQAIYDGVTLSAGTDCSY